MAGWGLPLPTGANKGRTTRVVSAFYFLPHKKCPQGNLSPRYVAKLAALLDLMAM